MSTCPDSANIPGSIPAPGLRPTPASGATTPPAERAKISPSVERRANCGRVGTGPRSRANRAYRVLPSRLNTQVTSPTISIDSRECQLSRGSHSFHLETGSHRLEVSYPYLSVSPPFQSRESFDDGRCLTEPDRPPFVPFADFRPSGVPTRQADCRAAYPLVTFTDRPGDRGSPSP